MEHIVFESEYFLLIQYIYYTIIINIDALFISPWACCVLDGQIERKKLETLISIPFLNTSQGITPIV